MNFFKTFLEKKTKVTTLIFLYLLIVAQTCCNYYEGVENPMYLFLIFFTHKQKFYHR